MIISKFGVKANNLGHNTIIEMVKKAILYCYTCKQHVFLCLTVQFTKNFKRKKFNLLLIYLAGICHVVSVGFCDQSGEI